MRIPRAVAIGLVSITVLVGSLGLSGASALGFFGHPYITRITEANGGPFGQPWGLALDPGGNLYVADATGKAVDVFDSSNVFSAQFGTGVFSQPYTRSVAVNNTTGIVYVAESGPETVDVFKPEGGGAYKLLQEKHFGNYMYVAVNNSSGPRGGEVYVISGSSSVHVIKPNASGELVEAGEELAAPAEGFSLLGPNGVGGLAIDGSTGTVYLANPGEGVVDEYNSNDEPLAQQLKPSSGSFEPSAVGIEEATHHVYVVDGANQRVDEFDNTGAQVGGIGSPLLAPLGVVVTAAGHVYVSDGGSEPTGVDVFGPSVLLPDVTTGAAGEVKKITAKLEGAVDPDGEAVTSCRFEYGPTGAYGQSVACAPTPGSGSSPVAVSGALSGLSQETLYHYRLVAGNAHGVNTGLDRTFTTSSAVDSLQTEAATNVEKAGGVNVATLNGSLRPDGSDTHYYFQYGETEAYGSTSPAPPGTDAGEASAAEAAQAHLSGLAAGVTYHFRLVGVNSFGTTYGSDVTFTTPLAVEGVVTSPATELRPTSVQLNGGLEPNGVDAHDWFEYGPTSSYGATTPHEDAGAAGGSQPASASITGLEPYTTYHYRLVAENTYGLSYGADETATTAALAPTVGSLPASSVTRVTATVSATVDPEKSPTKYSVLYGTTSSYGEHTEEFEAGSGNAGVAVHVGLVALAPGTTYHYTVVASNPGGTVSGPDQTFTTGAGTPPIATTGGASNLALTSATVGGTIATQGLETSYELDFGTDTGYGTSLYGEAGTAAEVNVALALQNLAPGTTYHYRLVAINSDGRAYGADLTFTTPVYVNPIILPSTLPLIASPAIPFPAAAPASGTTVKSLSKAQKLAKALKACKRKSKKQRAGCEKRAKQKYGPAKRKRKK